MKIIRAGKVKGLVWRGKCGRCGCEVECERNELKSMNDRNDVLFFVHCPTDLCDEFIWMESNER